MDIFLIRNKRKKRFSVNEHPIWHHYFLKTKNIPQCFLVPSISTPDSDDTALFVFSLSLFLLMSPFFSSSSFLLMSFRLFFLGVCGWILIVAVVTHTYILIHTHHPIYSSDDIYKYRCLHRHYRQRITHLSKVKHNISTDKIVIQLHQ